jgi:hypothetical protein
LPGRFATLGEVIDHHDTFFGLGLAAGEKTDLAAYLMSLGDAPAPGVVAAAASPGPR